VPLAENFRQHGQALLRSITFITRQENEMPAPPRTRNCRIGNDVRGPEQSGAESMANKCEQDMKTQTRRHHGFVTDTRSDVKPKTSLAHALPV
jgi:hypothetical protein